MALRDNLIFNLVAKFKTGTIENILTLGLIIVVSDNGLLILELVVGS